MCATGRSAARLARPAAFDARFPAVDPKATSLSLGSIAHPARPLRGMRLNGAPGLLIRLAALRHAAYAVRAAPSIAATFRVATPRALRGCGISARSR
jgi:hypothetical protein